MSGAEPTNVITVGQAKSPRRLVVLMHGVGANADDLVPVADALVATLPETRVLLPDAPYPFEGGGGGYQWFSIAGVTAANRAERVDRALPPIVAWIEKQRTAAHLTCEQLVVAGFSQGAILALAAAARGYACGHVLAFSGRLVDPIAKAHDSSPKIFLAHGESDAVIPAQESRDAATKLGAAGYTTQLRTYPGVGHGISPDALSSAIAFVR